MVNFLKLSEFWLRNKPKSIQKGYQTVAFLLPVLNKILYSTLNIFPLILLSLRLLLKKQELPEEAP